VNTSFIWIVFPGVIAVFCLFLQRRESMVAILGTLTALLLAALAYWLPSAEQWTIGPWNLSISDTWSVLGRQFVLSEADRPALIVLYLAVGLWFGAVPIARPGRHFVPFSLGVVTLLTAAIAVDPFLYAALLVEMAVLLSIPTLITSGSRVGRGVIRYLTFQTLGVPFILFAGWMLTGVEVTPGDQSLILRAGAFLGFGFAFLLAVFPFHTWIPMLARESHPYAAGFVFLLFPGAIGVFGLSFLERYVWLREAPGTYALLLVAGAVMVFTAGLWSAFQRDLGRLMGFALLLDTGFSFLALSQAHGERAVAFLILFFTALIPRGVSMGVWALCLSFLRRKAGGLDFGQVIGLGREHPVLLVSMTIAIFSLAGLPVLGSYPIRLAILQSLSSISPHVVFLALFGSLGLLIGGIRALTVFLDHPEQAKWKLSEPRLLAVYLLLGTIGLVLFGLVPQLLTQAFADLLAVFAAANP
jgi:formate hydrogenlyase subunit 3/multisubunit Na+/H+ antiporter MnhD subunit